MKLILPYLKQRTPVYAVAAAFFLIFAVCFWLYHLPLQAVLYPFLLCIAFGLLLSSWDFLRVKRRHEALSRIRCITDTMANDLPAAACIEGKDYQEIIRLMAEEHGNYHTLTTCHYADMVDYYTVWAHQIKTPLASMRLHLQNEDSPLSRTLSADLNRVEQYVEMVLTFLRLDSGSTDYVIREYDLDTIVRQAVKKVFP